MGVQKSDNEQAWWRIMKGVIRMETRNETKEVLVQNHETFILMTITKA